MTAVSSSRACALIRSPYGNMETKKQNKWKQFMPDHSCVSSVSNLAKTKPTRGNKRVHLSKWWMDSHTYNAMQDKGKYEQEIYGFIRQGDQKWLCWVPNSMYSSMLQISRFNSNLWLIVESVSWFYCIQNRLNPYLWTLLAPPETPSWYSLIPPSTSLVRWLHVLILLGKKLNPTCPWCCIISV